jgi:outer membrane protein assembly factor BamB
MIFHPFFISPWVPWAMLLIALLGLALLGLAARARLRLWKIVLGLSAPVVVSVLCTGLVVVNSYHAPLVNVPAPAPASLSLAFFQFPGATPASVGTLNARTGALRWHQAFGNTEVRVAADAHTLYLTTGAVIMALRASDGKALWQTPLSNPAHLQQLLSVTAAPILADGMVYLSEYAPGGLEVIEALRASDGVLVWSQALENYYEDSQGPPLAAGQGMVFVGAPTGNLSAFRSSDGALVWSWRATTSEAYQVVPAFAGGVVYAACSQQIVALHARDGTVVWSHPLATPLSNLNLSIGASSIYFEQTEVTATVSPDYLYSLSAQTGHMQWKYQVINAFGSRAIEAGHLVFFASDRYLDALRVSDGQRVWRHSSNSNVGFGAPFIANTVLFVKSAVISPRIQTTCPDECEPSAAVNALNAATGSLYWRSTWPGSDSSALVGIIDSSP